MPKQTVGEGESTASLAKQNGFFWRTIWNHPENAELRARRRDPSVLLAGDEIYIAEREIKEVSKATDSAYTFKRKGEPCKIKLQLFKLGKPRANEDYIIEVEGTQIKGKTDADGKIEHFIPCDARTGRLILRGGKEEYPLHIGYLDPIDEIVGIQQRLNNLGYNCPESNELDDETKEALKKFQAENNLEASGEIDGATKAKMQELSK